LHLPSEFIAVWWLLGARRPADGPLAQASCVGSEHGHDDGRLLGQASRILATAPLIDDLLFAMRTRRPRSADCSNVAAHAVLLDRIERVLQNLDPMEPIVAMAQMRLRKLVVLPLGGSEVIEADLMNSRVLERRLDLVNADCQEIDEFLTRIHVDHRQGMEEQRFE
jgi:hypothetical protein